ncbi:MAG TPA: hypothetical protein PLS29_01910 [Acidimicrobiales bacterium]|nr:hypothetical protein [Acidimicrobiales bacterium]
MHVIVKFDRVVLGSRYHVNVVARATGLPVGDHVRLVGVTLIYIGIGRTHYRASRIPPKGPGEYRVVARGAAVVCSASGVTVSTTRYVYTAGHLVITRSARSRG